MLKIDIGAGRSKRPGWLSLDADPRTKPDILAAVPPLPVSCRGASAFRLIHVLEHFYKWDAEELLAEFFDFLAPGGRLILELPNLMSAVAALSGVSNRPPDQWGYWVLYGDPRRKNPLFGHRWGWTPDTLAAALAAAGFSAENISHERPRHHVPDRDFRIVATK